MKQYFITGTSSGIGEALANEMLQDADNHVTRISRNQTIKHDRYDHISMDLTEIEKLNDFSFPVQSNADRICLVNNAGFLGDIKRVGTASNDAINRTFVLNTISPAILMNIFIGQIQELHTEKIILNISSGAGQYEIDSWASYCGSKAGIDHFSKTVQHEQEVTGGDVKILSIGPGVVDTNMQKEIRGANPDDFSRHGDFVQLKEKGELANPTTVAKKYVYVLNHTHKFDQVVDSLRNIEVPGL